MDLITGNVDPRSTTVQGRSGGEGGGSGESEFQILPPQPESSEEVAASGEPSAAETTMGS